VANTLGPALKRREFRFQLGNDGVDATHSARDTLDIGDHRPLPIQAGTLRFATTPPSIGPGTPVVRGKLIGSPAKARTAR